MGDLSAAVEYAQSLQYQQQQQAQQQQMGEDQQPRKVVVLGVPWQTEDSTLERHFGQFGAVEEAQIMRERYTGKSRGFGFVTFSAPLDAQRAVASEHLIDGRRCEAKFALPEGKVGSARTTRIFVARIPSSLGDAQFRGYFEQFGTVQDAYMPKDPSKQGHRGIGFVTYATAESVERVMAGTHVLNGNEIAIDRATPKDRGATMLPGRLSMSQPNLALLGGGGGSQHGNFGFLRMNGGQPPMPPSPSRIYEDAAYAGGLGGRRMSHPALPSSHSSQFGSPPGPHGMGGRLPSSGALPFSPNATLAGSYGSSGANLNLLAQAQAAALQHQLSSNSLSSLGEGGSSSQQLINLINANVAAAAAAATSPPGAGPHALHQSGSMAHLQQSSREPSASSGDMAGLLAQHDSMGSGNSSAPSPGGSWGAAPFQGRPPPGAGPFGPASARAGPRIFVGKLNRDTSEHDVKEYFSRFGYVLDVYLPRDKHNKREHRGFGFVTFETDASIQRVVSHGPHQIRGSIVAIDSAVPRQEELAFNLDTPAVAAPHLGAASPPSAQSALQGEQEGEALQAFEELSLGAGVHHGRPAVQGLNY